eukprot:gene1870-biopygen9430
MPAPRPRQCPVTPGGKRISRTDLWVDNIKVGKSDRRGRKVGDGQSQAMSQLSAKGSSSPAGSKAQPGRQAHHTTCLHCRVVRAVAWEESTKVPRTLANLLRRSERVCPGPPKSRLQFGAGTHHTHAPRSAALHARVWAEGGGSHTIRSAQRKLRKWICPPDATSQLLRHFSITGGPLNDPLTRGRFGVDSGLTRCRPGVDSVLTRGRFGVDPGSIRC